MNMELDIKIVPLLALGVLGCFSFVNGEFCGWLYPTGNHGPIGYYLSAYGLASPIVFWSKY